ncbi:TonB-dependent receptor [Novosphingobium cyanobacteriorum]|uniref:TonB-dependent receptor n=1 Tax=Novosphingobium cyanobacteriorum TaxID=3024215 RepID=A0ABT6CE60_9SPHN|nr:TonB-dependent receptor [Novosphingobium cyanobacteriorum]MDF8332212.1 TonB-dependent receptor [Novosphingobium cyanobacteriorum]
MKILCSSVISMSVMLATQASAQTATNSAGTSDEIIVTAQKRSQNIQDVPISITAIQAEALSERDIQSLSDLTTSLPGIKFAEFSGSGNIAIRGIGTTIVSGTGEGSVAVHVDGVYLAQTQALTMIQSDIGRVEVLRGPQSTLYGRNSTGGVINFISAMPTSTLEGEVGLLYGNYDRKQAQGYISGALSDKVRIRVSGQYQDREGWTRNTITGQKLEGLESYGGRIAIDADLTEGWNVQLRASHSVENFGGPVYDSYDPNFPVLPAPLSEYDPRKVASNVIYDSTKKLSVVSLRNQWDLGSANLVSTTGVTDYSAAGVFDGIGSAISVPLDRKQTNRAISQELNLSGKTDALDWIIGLYFYTEKIAQDSKTGLASLGLPDNSLLQSARKTSYSAFTDLTYHVSDQVRIYGGARVLREKLRQNLQVQSGAALSCSGANEQNYRDTAVTGRVGAQYDVSSDVMVYGQYSRGYKPGGFSSSKCDNLYVNETIDAVEGGVKSALPRNLGTLNAAVFYYKYKNLQLEQASVAGIPYVNAPRAHVFGAEMQALVSVSPTTKIDVSATYLDAKYDEFLNQDPLLGVAAGVSLRGVALNNAPKFSTTVGLEQKIRLTSDTGLKLRGEFIYSSKYNIREFNKPYTIQDGYVMLNAFATFDFADRRYSLNFFGKNLTNRTLLAGALGFGGALGSFQPPRTYGTEFTVRF